jgi:hypothetical protein
MRRVPSPFRSSIGAFSHSLISRSTCSQCPEDYPQRRLEGAPTDAGGCVRADGGLSRRRSISTVCKVKTYRYPTAVA